MADSDERSGVPDPEDFVEDRFRDSLRGKPPPGGRRYWGYKITRSDRTAGGELVWPGEEPCELAGEGTDGYMDGITEPGVLAVVTDISRAWRTTAAGGTLITTVAFDDTDIADHDGQGVVFLRRADVVDVDLIGMNLSQWLHACVRPEFWALNGLDRRDLEERERASYIGHTPLPEPLSDEPSGVSPKWMIGSGVGLGHAESRCCIDDDRGSTRGPGGVGGLADRGAP